MISSPDFSRSLKSEKRSGVLLCLLINTPLGGEELSWNWVDSVNIEEDLAMGVGEIERSLSGILDDTFWMQPVDVFMGIVVGELLGSLDLVLSGVCNCGGGGGRGWFVDSWSLTLMSTFFCWLLFRRRLVVDFFFFAILFVEDLFAKLFASCTNVSSWGGYVGGRGGGCTIFCGSGLRLWLLLVLWLWLLCMY